MATPILKTVPLPRISRRRMLDLMIGLSAVAWIGGLLLPVLRYLKPMGVAGPGGPLRLSPEELGKLAKDKFVILRAGAARILVIQDGPEAVRALSAKCTHEGCTVQFVPGESVIWCACHNGRFALDGRVLAGPPPRPLPRYSAKRGPDGSVTVSLETT